MNESQLKDILPMLRPRSAEPTLFSQTVWYLLWIGLAAIVVLYLYRLYRHRRQRHAAFLVVCQDAGITEAQTRLLERITAARKVRHPERLLSNAHAFERQAGAYAQDLARRQPRSKQLRQIARLREDLGFDHLPADQALISTRQIERGQTVMISDIDELSLEEILVPWLVLDRDEGVLELSPLLREGAGHRHERGEELTIRFWREGDTEYEFRTRVRAVDDQNITVAHATRVDRRQQRDFYRIHVDFPLDLYGLPQPDQHQPPAQPPEIAAIALLDEEDSPARINEETAQEHPSLGSDHLRDIPAAAERLHGRVQDLSAGGLALIVSGSALPAGSLATAEEPARWVWMIDPAFEGDFPLAGVTCQAVSSEPVEGQQLVKLQFDRLPATVEKEIVQRIYQHQLETAGGAPETMRPRAVDAPDSPEDETIDVESTEPTARIDRRPPDLT